ncbi:MAG: hypothetical protein A2W90_18825 [Bacteroidetes bacterium GWF2_42_66]|nr:MAG: hypothetical protein A2W92_05630 [Bacteroidetes bacterium GWA2_42_15]OFX98773.1 MAG: hypothetical protein A2W89_10870 [Bacteroidetes bacterium GWE2_42_39]OFY43030.1 MAG: hypothetical protein A2W90_18825 [Bacteroidetes bacterium GWF2_42_66]HBL77132.1 hypothetical protein [Prolixibacteraceae bacterium]HCR91423.1 hypothetical protein [Prolixibacteraceae bacterium]
MKLIKHPWLFLLLSFAITIAVKIPHLGLPFFNDETFSYYPAILEMAKTGPGMMPGILPIILSKGHPLFFYFLASLWVKYIAGNSIALTHVFPLLIALFALFVFHRFAKRHTNIVLANIAVVLLSVKTMFLAQASLLLPEIFLFCLFMLCFDAYLSGNYKLYALFGSLMMLTKETGAVFIMVFGISYLIENYRNIKTRKFWMEITMLAIPVFVYGIFLILHYSRFGVFFFSEHLDYITVERFKVLYKSKSAFSTLFLKHGRNIVFFSGIIALSYLLIRRKAIEYKRFLILSLFILISFFIFTILNFYIYRYVFPVMGIMLLASLALVQQVKTKYQIINIGYIAIIVAVSGYYTATKRGQSDADLGYVQFLKVHKQMVEYCEQQGWYDQEFGAGYNMVMSMRDNFAGYLNTDKNFRMHHLPGIKDRNFIMYDSTCWPYEMPKEERDKLELVKRFQYKKHWGEIYKVRE